MVKVKKSKAPLTFEEKLGQALVADWEQPYKVPDNWCWTTLKSISNLYNGDRGSNYPSKKDYVSEGVPFINAGAIQNNTLDETEFNYITQQKYDTLRAGKIQKNDILYCLRGSLGKTAIIETDMTGAISSSLCIIRAKRDVQPKYLAYLLRTGLVAQQQYIAENGSAQPNLSAASVMEYKLPISPFNEQQRIVDRIERMFLKLDEVKENVQNVIDGFENRKSAILHKAFNGELTAKWREENSHELSNWEKTTLKECTSKIGDGLHGTPRFKDGEKYYFVNGNNFSGKCIEIKLDTKTVSEDEYKKHYIELSTDTTVFVSINGTLGKTAFYNNEAIILGKSACYVNVLEEKLNKYFLRFYFNSKEFIDYANTMATGSTIKNLGLKAIREMPLLLPPLKEQSEIVRILDKIILKEQQAKEKAESVLEQINIIKKSILARAFRGELGTNNPGEESSIELLKTVLSEDKNEKRVTKPKSKRVSIPVEVKAMLSNHLEKDILKLFYKVESNEVSIDDIMSVSSNKFEIMDALKALEEKKLVSKRANGIYKLAR